MDCTPSSSKVCEETGENMKNRPETLEEDENRISDGSDEEKHAELGIFPIKWSSTEVTLPPISYETLHPVPAPSFEYKPFEQVGHINKLKINVLHRRHQRMKNLCQKSVLARDILDSNKLRQACTRHDYTKVVNLLEVGVDPCAVDDRKRSPLHFAAAKGYDDIAKLLLDAGADPNQKDQIGNTPLHLAVCGNHINVVTTLLKSGTNARSLDNNGRTPLHLAQSRLRILHNEPNYTPTKLREECLKLVDMMKHYLTMLGTEDNVDELSDLCNKMSLASTRTEMDNVSDLLSQFTDLNIEKQKQNKSGEKRPP